MRKFVISDIHGCNRTFNALLRKIGFSRQDELYLLGDLIDRGPDSKGVIDTIMQLRNDKYTVYCLRGNHEELFLDAFLDNQFVSDWVNSGGYATLESFGADLIHEVPEEYIYFFKTLPLVYQIDSFILVHAGLKWDGENSPFTNREALLCIRNWHDEIDYEWLGGRFIVHGHTPQTQHKTEAQLSNLQEGRFLCIDGGCFRGMTPPTEMGQLISFELTQQKLAFQSYIG